MPKFKTTLRVATGMDAMGIEVPPAIVEGFGQGKRPKVSVTLKGYTYRSTVSVMGGQVHVAAGESASRGGGRDRRRQG